MWLHLLLLLTGWYELELAQSVAVVVQDRSECSVGNKPLQF